MDRVEIKIESKNILSTFYRMLLGRLLDIRVRLGIFACLVGGRLL